MLEEIFWEVTKIYLNNKLKIKCQASSRKVIWNENILLKLNTLQWFTDSKRIKKERHLFMYIKDQTFHFA